MPDGKVWLESGSGSGCGRGHYWISSRSLKGTRKATEMKREKGREGGRRGRSPAKEWAGEAGRGLREKGRSTTTPHKPTNTGNDGRLVWSWMDKAGRAHLARDNGRSFDLT